MTAVAPPPNFQNLSRSAWGSANGASNGLQTMSADDVSRMLMPRKTAPRSNSSSSLSSLSSNSSTISASSTNSNGAPPTANGDAASRKRPVRYLWPMSKAEPTAGISTARPQSVASTSSGPSAASAISALHAPAPMLNSQSNQALSQQNGAVRGPHPGENTPVLYLTPMNGTFERKTITVPFYPDVLRIGRQTNAKTVPTPLNGYFDSKVLSRAHAEVWADRSGKIWIRDIKSSNGTFVNGQRLSQENKDSEPHELRESDMLELGIDIVSEDQKTVVHHKVAARVEHSGFLGPNALLDLNFGEVDQSNGAGMMGMSLGQGVGHMRRNSNQGTFAGGVRGPGGMPANMNGLAQQRPQHVWLTPINIEQVIKRLSAEYKSAKQQSYELQRSAQFLDGILSSDPPQRKDSSPPIPLPLDRLKGRNDSKDLSAKPRFSDPPNPPPQAPLPDKPFDIAGNNALLRRADTERPKLPNGEHSSNGVMRADTSTNSQIASLSAALELANKEFENQSKRLREMEDLLVEERMRREDAEARAKRLENDQAESRSIKVQIPNGAQEKEEDEHTTPIEDEVSSEIGKKSNDGSATQKLHQRLDLLLAEFQEVKASAERWKLEKEEAEKERDEEKKEKLGLMDMIVELRKEHRENSEKETKKRGKKALRGVADEEDRPASTDGPSPTNSVPKNLFSNGHLSGPLLHASGKDGGTSFASHTGQMVQAAPYISAMSVVLIGVAVMALVNKMSRGER